MAGSNYQSHKNGGGVNGVDVSFDSSSNQEVAGFSQAGTPMSYKAAKHQQPPIKLGSHVKNNLNLISTSNSVIGPPQQKINAVSIERGKNGPTVT